MSNAFNLQGATPFKMPTFNGTSNSFLDNYSKTTAQNKALNNIVASPAGNQNVPNKPVAKPLNLMTVAEAKASGQYPEYQKLVSGIMPPTNQDVKSHVIGADGSVTQTYRPTTVTAKPTVAPAPPVTFPEMINTSAAASSNAANTGAANYNTANQGLITATAGNQQYADRAKQIADAAGQKISDIGGQGARGQAGYLTTGTSPVGEGNAAVLAQTTAAQQQAVSQGANMQLAGNAQGLTAQNQMQSGYNQASGNALTGQGQGISGLNTAAGLAQPQFGTPGQAGYNPLNPGEVTGGITPEIMNQYATMAANGQLSAIPTSITSNPVLNAQLNAAAKAINPAYNPITSGAQGSITAGQQQNVANMTTAYKSATNLGSQLKDLITTFGINPADINAVNTGISKIANNVSSPQYKALNNLVTDLVSTYSSILTPGSSTDTARATAASLLDASAKGSSIMDTLNYLDEQAKAKIAGQTTGYNEKPGTSSSGAISWDNL